MRPKWQHPKPEVRAAAMAALEDQSLLADIVERDESDTVRLAALQRLTNQSALGRIARSSSPFNTRAFGIITDEREIVDVARTAEAPRVRRLALDKIADPLVLHQIMAFDDDASVRKDARSRRFRLGVDPIRGFLARVLAGLEITGTAPDRPAELSGGLEEVCNALVCDQRFRINGILIGRKGEPSDAPSDSRPGVPVQASPQSCCDLEFVAANCGGEGGEDDCASDRLYYRIKIWRLAENTFHVGVEQRQARTTHNVAVWSASSGGGGELFRGGETSVRIG